MLKGLGTYNIARKAYEIFSKVLKNGNKTAIKISGT
jgi:hypothetical protein